MGDVNRYETNPLDGPAQMAEWVREIERRVGALEGAPTIGSNLVAKDSDGNPLVSVGTLSDGSRGIEVASETDTWDLFKLTTAGWIKPHFPGVAYDPSASKAVTSATFVETWRVLFGDYLGPGVEVMVTWATGAGTTGELQVVSNGGGTTATHALPAASSGVAFVRWLHGTPVGAGPFTMSVQARRTAGANNVTIYPCHAWIQDPAFCTGPGTWL